MKTITQSPEYVGDCTVINKAEFARLIRKAKRLRVTLFIQDGAVERCQNNLVSIDVPAKQALEKLARCDFDAFDWGHDEFGPHIWHYAAPTHLQLARRRDFLVARIPEMEARLVSINERLALYSDENQDWRRKIRDGEVQQIAWDRAEIAKINERLAAMVAAHPGGIENGISTHAAA